ncbi:MAG: protein phosphatase 2C domain-containing protein [Actinomycetota bacterium]
MSTSSQAIYCPNPACTQPRNSFGRQACEACQTHLIYRYLWAVGPEAKAIPPGEVIADRYWVVASQVWLDTKPGEPPHLPERLPNTTLSYLNLYPHRLHLPEVYGFCPVGQEPTIPEILLLDNIPVDLLGNLMPAIVDVWSGATAVRQVYWLWQILQLWTPLSEQGLASSLLEAENIRVEGWRVRLRELYAGRFKPTLRDLANSWLPWIEVAQTPVQQDLQAICQLLGRAQADLQAVATELNQLLLEQAAQLPLHLEVVGATDPGPNRKHNEDSCYPTAEELQQRKTPSLDKLIPRFTLVCDGVGGHDGGEVASQLAVQSLKPLIQTLLVEVEQQSELTPPALVSKQLEEIVRVVNNVIAAQNNDQGRESRQRMGTTLAMALQLPQKVTLEAGRQLENAHELYLVHVGDSRAYWITQDYCHRLTVDDDVATREVRLGRCLYWEALRRSDAGALTQALGTRDAEFLHPTIQRFIVEEDGLLLLCSDGLSDNDWVEKSWVNYGPAVLKGEMSLEAAIESWMQLANEKNGHDNTSIVITHCRISPEKLVLFTPTVQLPSTTSAAESELSEASKALLYGDTVPPPSPVSVKRRRRNQFPGWLPVLGVLMLLLAGGAVIWWLNSRGSDRPTPEVSQPPASSPSP